MRPFNDKQLSDYMQNRVIQIDEYIEKWVSDDEVMSNDLNILADNIDKAEDYILFFDNVFNHNFSLELQFHPLYDDQKIINKELVALSDNYGIPLTVSCDSHFVDKTDKNLRRIVQSISWHKKLADVNDSMDSNCVGSADIIRNNAIQSGFEDMQVVNNALKQTYVIANRCNASIDDTSNKIPAFTKHTEFDKVFREIW